MTDEQDERSTPPTGHTLGEMLKAARESTGLELIELSRQTAVRGDYLAALEEDRLDELPEPVYVRNFVRLYAQAVGLDARKALEMYGAALVAEQGSLAAAAAEPPARRRRDRAAAAAGTAGSAAAAQPARTAQAGAAPRQTARTARPKDQPRFRGIGTWLPSLLLIVLVVGLAVWGFNSTLFRPGTATQAGETGSTQAEDPAQDSPGGLTGPAAETEPGAADSVRLTVTTEPAGARVLVDAFPIEGLTPITGAPVTARESRLIRVELEGHEPFEAPFDLTFDRNLSFVLQEAAEPEAGLPDDPDGEPGAAASEEGTITVTVSDESWLEIYPGTAREGTPHVYTTAAPGETWSFDLPVFVRVGNAAGVSVSVGGTDLGPLGSAGEITGRAFTAED